jgi:hypothetical protein
MNIKKKVLIGLTILIVVILVSAFITWQFIRVSPQYSVYRIYKAVENHDYDTFKKYVDVEGVSNNVVDKVFSKAEEYTKKEALKADAFSQMGYELGIALVMQMKPKIKEEMVSEIKKSVETGNFKKDYKPQNISDYYNHISVNKDGKIADVVIKVKGKDDLKLKMRNKGDYWQIFDMDLPLPKTDMNDKSGTDMTVNAKFGEKVNINDGWYLTIEEPEEYIPTGYLSPKEGNKYITVKVTYENTSNKPDSFSTYNLKLKDNKDFSYSDTSGGKEPRIDSGDLEANGKVTGYMTFEIPSENKTKSIIYSGTKSILFTQPEKTSSSSAKTK